MHTQESPLKGQTVHIKKDVTHFQDANFGGSEFIVEDWWDKLEQKSWMWCDGNPGCLVYAMRSTFQAARFIPIDDEVLYGHTPKNGLGHLVHVSELDV
jgi:hypothetical protein